jgi:hypothetical protein
MCPCHLENTIRVCSWRCDKRSSLTSTHAIEVHEVIEKAWAPPVEVGSHHERLELSFLALRGLGQPDLRLCAQHARLTIITCPLSQVRVML